jgi:hypothetical protein
VCGNGQLLEIRELQIEGRHAMPADAFLAGHAIAPGARYG